MKAIFTAPGVDDDPLEIVRSVDLTDDDYVRAGLRPRARKKMPAEKPFDREEAAKRICQGFADARITYSIYKFDPAMSRDEAIMLIHAVFRAERRRLVDYTPSDLLALPTEMLSEKPIFHSSIWISYPNLASYLLFRLYSPAEFVEHIVAGLVDSGYSSIARLEYIRTSLLPYASDEAIAEMQDALSPHLPTGQTLKIDTLLFAVVLRHFEPVKAWLEIPLSPLLTYSDTIQHIVLSLGDAEAIERNYRRLGRRLSSPIYARQLLAATQTQGLSLIAQIVAKQNGDTAMEAMIKVAARVQAPETALYMLRWQMAKKAKPVCKEWFESNPKHAAAGLTPIVAGDDEEDAAEASAVLRDLVRRGHETIVRAHLQTLPLEVFERVSGPILEFEIAQPKYEALNEANTPELLRVSPGINAQPKPGDPIADDLPAIAVSTDDGLRRLNDAQIYTLIHALQKSKLGAPQPYVEAVRIAVTPQSRDAFAWALMESWLADGAIVKEKWKMYSVGLLGGEGCILKLMPLIRQWPGDGQHARAVTGLLCLEAIGTDTALMQINGLAQKAAFKGLKGAAVRCIEGIATKRGLTRSELEDRIVPDCGLDDRGSRIFDFGPRQFVMSLSPDMKPVLREIKDGKTLPKRLTDLPKPNQKDDPLLSENAVADWKTLKKQVAETAKIQAVRLEQAMVIGRRWTAQDFDLLLVHHPLMTNIARLLVWGAYDDKELIGSFRVTEDLTYADAQDGVYNLPGNTQIGIVHPLQLPDAVRAAWGEILGDYEIVPPFPQLGRPVYTLESEEAGVTDLTRFEKFKLPSATLIFTLDKLEWMRAVPADGGGFSEHTKPFHGVGVTAVAQYTPGCYAGDVAGGDPQTIDKVLFVPKIYLPGEWWPEHKDRIPWSEVDPVVISEVLADLTSIAAKVQ